MNYPIDFTFKLLAIASQIYIRDADGTLLGYVKQKLFKLKEEVDVYEDESQSLSGLLFNIKADRVFDFSAKYNFTNGRGRLLGSIKRRGMRSLFKASYEIYDERDVLVMKINEENGWIKVADALIGEIPIVGIFTGLFLNPSFIVSRLDAQPVARLKKEPAFFEAEFRMTKLDEMSPEEEERVMLSLLMMTLLERSRG